MKHFLYFGLRHIVKISQSWKFLTILKGILNQQELPTITDCQFLRIGFIDHQIFLQNKSTHKKNTDHTNLTRKLEKNLKVHFISALTTITLGYNSLSAEILDRTYQMISSPEAYDMHKQSWVYEIVIEGLTKKIFQN